MYSILFIYRILLVSQSFIFEAAKVLGWKVQMMVIYYGNGHCSKYSVVFENKKKKIKIQAPK